jgi:cyclophilin family peptidyl-prolyl cis-trans isomerase
MKLHLLVAATLTSGLLASCGGGGGDSGGPAPVVTASSASTARYSEPMLITLTGSNLDQALTLTSSGCKNFARSTTAPFVSSATVAYYTCTASGVGSLTVNVSGGGTTVATVPFTVAQPQVTMLVNNGAGVSGTLVITLRPQEAPITVDNFLAYVKSGFYNGTVFHRHGRTATSAPFVLQGGGFTGPLTAGAVFPAAKPASAPIALEAQRGLSNLRYTLAMARTGVPNSATSQFFINTVDNLFLNGTSAVGNEGYAVFGTVTTGTTVVDAMVAAPCSLSPVNFNSGFTVSTDCLPVPNLVIASATQSQ